MKAVRGVTAGTSFLPIAILFAVIASYHLVSAWQHGKATDWIIATIFAFFCYRFFRGWQYCRRNRCVMLYNDELMIFREKPNFRHGTRFKSVRRIDQDRWGYTLILEMGDRFRLLRRDLQPDLKLILAAHQDRLKCENPVAQAQSPAV